MKKATTGHYVSNCETTMGQIEDYNSTKFDIKLALEEVERKDRSLFDEMIWAIILLFSSFVYVIEKGRWVTRVVVLAPVVGLVLTNPITIRVFDTIIMPATRAILQLF